MRIGKSLRAALMVFALAGVAGLVGCDVAAVEEVDEATLVGTWYEYFTCDTTGDNLLSIWSFDDDGTLAVQNNSNRTDGTWTLSGSTLGITLSTLTVLDSSDCWAMAGSYTYSVTVTDEELVLSAGGQSAHFYRSADTAREHLNGKIVRR